MLYLQYQLHNSWEQTYKLAPTASNTQILTKKTPTIDIMLKSTQFGPVDNTY